MLLFVVIAVPVIFTIMMDAMEMLYQKDSWQSRLMKIAWDLCVLTLGLAAGLFADREILTTLNKQGLYQPVGLLLCSLLVSLSVAVSLAFLRRSQTPSGWKALLALALGACTLVLPVYLAALRPE